MRYVIKYRLANGDEIATKVDSGRTYTNKREAARRAKELNATVTTGRYVVCEI